MTAEPQKHIKITYATLRADNEELHAAYEAGLEKAKARLGQHHQNWIGGAARDGDGVFELRSPIDRDSLVGTFARGTRKDVQDAIAAARTRPAGLVRARLGAAAGDPGSRRRADQRAPDGVRRADGHRGRQEPARGAGRGRGGGRPHPLLLEDGRATTRFYDHPMDNLGDSAVHTKSILRPFGVFAVIAPFNFPMALSAGPSSAAMMAGNTVVFKPASQGAMSGVALAEAYRDAGVPDGVFNLVMGPGDTVGEELRREPGHRRHRLHRLVRGRVRAVPDFSTALPAAVHRRDGRQEPGHRHRSRRTSRRRPRASCARRSGSAARSAPRTRRVYVERPVHDEFVRLLVEKTEKLEVGDPLPRTAFARPGHRPEGRRPPPAGGRRGAPRRDGVHRRRAPDRRRARARASTSSPRSSAPAGRAPPVPGRAVRAVHGGRRPSTRSTRRCRSPTTTSYGLTAGIYSRGPGRGPARSSTRSRRASCTSTGAPARRRAPGRASSRSAAGRARARPARPGCRCTTSASSCASRATRSSTEPPGRRRCAAGARRPRGPRGSSGRRWPVRCCPSPTPGLARHRRRPARDRRAAGPAWRSAVSNGPTLPVSLVVNGSRRRPWSSRSDGRRVPAAPAAAAAVGRQSGRRLADVLASRRRPRR